MLLALNSGANENEAATAFLMVRRMILAGGKGTLSAGSTVEKVVYIDKVSDFTHGGSTIIKCTGLRMMYMIDATTKFVYENNDKIKLRIKIWGEIRNPEAEFIYDGTNKMCDHLKKIIMVVYNIDLD